MKRYPFISSFRRLYEPGHNQQVVTGLPVSLTSLLLLVCTLFLPLRLVAQPDSLRMDTTNMYELPGVKVTGRSLLPKVARSVRPTAVISGANIQASGAQDLADAVAYAPGVFVKRYGGLGGLRTVSLRGTAAQQTVLFIDGVRYRNSTESGFDFGNIPAAALEKVEVIRGGDALLFGANSLGGAVNVVTGRELRDELHLQSNIAAGSFGTRELGVSGVVGLDGHSLDAGLYLTSSDGDYPFDFNEFGDEKRVVRENGDFTNLFGRLAWAFREDNGWDLGLSLQGYSTARGVPGAVVQGSREQLHARLEEQDLFFAGRAGKTQGRWNTQLSLSTRTNRLRYRDPDARLNGPDGIHNVYDKTDGAVVARAMWFPDDETSLSGTLEGEYAELRGDNLDPSVGDYVKRIRIGSAVKGGRLFQDGFFGKEFQIDGGLRFDWYSDIAAQASPSFGCAWRPFSEPVRLRAHTAFNYRAPAFNEQYYLNFGNADLKAEDSRSLSVGATWEATESFVVEGGGFLIDTRNQIVSIPRSPVSWSAQNIGKVLSRGLELGAVGSFFQNVLDVQASYTLMEARDRTGGITHDHLLPYAPQELFNGILAVNGWGLKLSGAWEYVSFRHTLAYNTPESALPHHLLFNVGLAGQKTFSRFQLSGKITLTNLTDEAYQVVRNYPMPGRSIRIEIGAGWKKKL